MLVFVMTITAIPETVLASAFIGSELRANFFNEETTVLNPFQYTGGISSTGTDDFIPITNAADLNAIRNNINGNFRLMADIDLSGIDWEPIGSFPMPFSGTFDGNGYTIRNLHIYRPAMDQIGLFSTNTGRITNLNIDNPYVTGRLNVGSLVGINRGGHIQNVAVTGARIRSMNNSGGLVGGSTEGGRIYDSTVSDSPSITSGGPVGGLIGQNVGSVISRSSTFNIEEIRTSFASHVGGLAGVNASWGRIEYSFSRDIAALGYNNAIVGGLVGFNSLSTIYMSYSTNDVAGNRHTGGLVAHMQSGTIERSFAAGNVTGVEDSGGLVGFIRGTSYIANSFAIGDVALSLYSAGFAGRIDATAARMHIDNSFSLSNNPNGFSNGGIVRNGFFELDRIENPSAAVIGSPQARTAEQMKQQATFTGWDFDNIWVMQDGMYPTLRGLPSPFEQPGGTERIEINIVSKLPSGVITDSYIDIEFIATPGPGADIAEIFYTINGGPRIYVYPENNSRGAGQTVQVRIYLALGTNNVEFTVVDSFNNTGTHSIELRAVEAANLATIGEYAKWNFHFTEAFEAFQADVGFDMLEGLDDFSDLVIPEPFLDELRVFLHDVLRDSNSNARSDQRLPSAANEDRAAAMQHSFEMAYASVRRNPSRNIAAESQYMFISHFVDVPSPYWLTGNSQALNQGPMASRSFYAGWITDEDRRIYRNYMTITGVAETLGNLADIAIWAISNYESIDDLITGSRRLGQGIVDKRLGADIIKLDKLYKSSSEVWNNSVVPIINRTLRDVENNPYYSLQVMYDQFMNDPGLTSMVPYLPDRDKMVRNVITFIAVCILGGKMAIPFVGIAASVASFSVNFAVNIFQIAAWTAMRQHFNGRLAMRMMYAWGLAGHIEIDGMYYIFNDEDGFLYWLYSLPAEFWEYAGITNMEELLLTLESGW